MLLFLLYQTHSVRVSQVFLFGSFTEDEATTFLSPALDPSLGKKTPPPAKAVKQNGIHAAKPTSVVVKQNGHVADSKGVNASNGRVTANGKAAAAENAVHALGRTLGQSGKKQQPARPGVAVPAGGAPTGVKASAGGSNSAKPIESQTSKTFRKVANGGGQSAVNHTAILTPKAPIPAQNGDVKSPVKVSDEVVDIPVSHAAPAPTKVDPAPSEVDVAAEKAAPTKVDLVASEVDVAAENGNQADWLVINSVDVPAAKALRDAGQSSPNLSNGNAANGDLAEPATLVGAAVGSNGSADAPPSKLVPKSWAALVGVPGDSNVISRQSTVGKGKGRGSAGQAGPNKAQAAEIVAAPVTVLSGETWLRSLREAEVSGRRLRPRGLINTGNSCFLNSTVQAMLSCSAFTHLLQVLKARNIPQVFLLYLLSNAPFLNTTTSFGIHPFELTSESLYPR